MYPAVRGLILLTLLLLVGTATTAMLRERHGPPADSAEGIIIDGWLRRFPGLAAWFLLVLSMARGALQVLAFTFPGERIEPALARDVLSAGSWGTGWIVQTCGAFALLALSWLLRNDRRRLRWVVAGFALVLIVAQSGMGHGADMHWSPTVLGRAVHVTHLLGAGLWLGTLAMLALAVIPSLHAHRHLPMLSALIGGYSRVARLGVALVVTSGLIATWRYSTAITELPESRWGVLLLVKLGLVAAAGLVGLYNWRRLTPRLLADSPGSANHLLRSAAVEVAIGVGIVAVTALLAAAALPIDAAG